MPTSPPGGTCSPARCSWSPASPAAPAPALPARGGGGLRAAQRTAEAARLLSAADLTVSALDGGQVTALLTAAADPGADIHAARLAVPGQPVTSPGTLP